MDTLRSDCNLTLLCDFYEFTMMNGYLRQGTGDRIAYFDLFFRKVPDEGGYAIFAGLEQAVEYIRDLVFSDGDIAYLRSKKIFCEEFLSWLKNFKFCCDIWAVPEGTVIFPQEPLVIVRGPVMQAQLLETMLLLTINHQSLVATKASRIVRAAQGRPIMEFGARRAHGHAGALYGTRAAYIGGCVSSSCTLADVRFGIPASGTMAHSWVQLFDSEYDAFKAYAEVYPQNCILLVDTYDVLGSGIPNAIRVFRETVIPAGYRPGGIRIDSGDITYLSVKARKMLDEAGLYDCKIVVSNSLDEYIIRDTLSQGAKIDAYGVGERLITSKSEPVFGGVYKLSAVENDRGEIIPKIKLSENVTKITLPHFKRIWRLYDVDNGRAIADVITLHSEAVDDSQPYEIFHPEYTWKRKLVKNFRARQLLVPIYEKGKLVYSLPPVRLIREYCAGEIGTLWDEVKRFENPHEYYVDLSPGLWNVRNALLQRPRAD